MDPVVFQKTLGTLHTYSEIYYNLSSTKEYVATKQLAEIINDMIHYLHDKAKGQVA
jgi:ABC-type uncharacterized transport system involved in gliding motility auxiliary subunit